MIDVIQLADGDSRARVQVGQGFNCFEFSARPGGGDRVDAIWAEPDHASGRCRPSGGGIPLLFPFPGRIGGATMRWEGRDYQLTPGDGRGNAIHGFAYSRRWRVVQQSADSVTGEFQLSRDAADCLVQWPSDFRIQARYQLTGARLRCDVTAANVGAASMPAGFGAHPYFRLPGGEVTEVRLPVASHWELADMLPTGRCRHLPDAERWQQGQPLSSLRLDDVFGDLQYDDGACLASLHGDQAAIMLRFGQPLSHLVVYTPGHRESVCIEPYSCVPGDVRLGERAGWTAMAPGQQRRYWFEIELA